ncbi:C-type lectin domain family 17, member A isoform X2 [Microcaecilia unicolor]|uniref:C-type lectin domain family 17, member A-like isoform X2 n=1 Tax=Microcaecilia unicolor TaxID=1415580 RepID=A0A6P7XJF4_9AMPH|nr:C-type lectin domain family 17, member A-like isoform X2 [Microcaecilia unicolor]
MGSGVCGGICRETCCRILSAGYLDLAEVKQKDLSRIDKSLEELKETVGSICQACASRSICQECPLGWLLFRGSCYKFSTTAKDWEGARISCAESNSHLAIINSLEEQYFLSNSTNSKDSWIGLSDKDTEGVWQWVDGSPLSFSFWNTGEPNNYMERDEDCVQLRYDKGWNGEWNDSSCKFTFLWICEKRSLCNLGLAG